VCLRLREPREQAREFCPLWPVIERPNLHPRCFVNPGPARFTPDRINIIVRFPAPENHELETSHWVVRCTDVPQPAITRPFDRCGTLILSNMSTRRGLRFRRRESHSGREANFVILLFGIESLGARVLRTQRRASSNVGPGMDSRPADLVIAVLPSDGCHPSR